MNHIVIHKALAGKTELDIARLKSYFEKKKPGTGQLHTITTVTGEFNHYIV